MPTPRETVDMKAHRLQAQVRWIAPAVAQVQGDHAIYLVDRLNGAWRCNCRWGAHRVADAKHCSHVLAARSALAKKRREKRPVRITWATAATV